MEPRRTGVRKAAKRQQKIGAGKGGHICKNLTPHSWMIGQRNIKNKHSGFHTVQRKIVHQQETRGWNRGKRKSQGCFTDANRVRPKRTRYTSICIYIFSSTNCLYFCTFTHHLRGTKIKNRHVKHSNLNFRQRFNFPILPTQSNRT